MVFIPSLKMHFYFDSTVLSPCANTLDIICGSHCFGDSSKKGEWSSASPQSLLKMREKEKDKN